MNEQSQLELFTAKQATRLLSISPRQLGWLTQQKQIRAIKIGKRGVRYSAQELRDFLASGGYSPGK
jgi:hypothetical protein